MPSSAMPLAFMRLRAAQESCRWPEAWLREAWRLRAAARCVQDARELSLAIQMVFSGMEGSSVMPRPLPGPHTRCCIVGLLSGTHWRARPRLKRRLPCLSGRLRVRERSCRAGRWRVAAPGVHTRRPLPHPVGTMCASGLRCRKGCGVHQTAGAGGAGGLPPISAACRLFMPFVQPIPPW